MSIIDNALEANKTYAKKYDRKLGAHPTPQDRSCNLHGSQTFKPP
jgi:hypothetical protein